jgi:hypothetical protein
MNIKEHHLGRPIDPTQLTKTSRKTAVADASTLGWAPGDWPTKITLTTSNGTRYEFERISLYGEGARYRHHRSHSTIVVLND